MNLITSSEFELFLICLLKLIIIIIIIKIDEIIKNLVVTEENRDLLSFNFYIIANPLFPSRLWIIRCRSSRHDRILLSLVTIYMYSLSPCWAIFCSWIILFSFILSASPSLWRLDMWRDAARKMTSAYFNEKVTTYLSSTNLQIYFLWKHMTVKRLYFTCLWYWLCFGDKMGCTI